MVDMLVVFGLVMMGLVGLALWVVTAALRDAQRRLADINERLLLLVGLDRNGPEAARALVAHAQAPRQRPPVEAPKPPEKKSEGIVVRYGVA